MKIDIDFPTPKELLIKKMQSCFSKNVEEIQRFVGDEFFLEVVDADFEELRYTSSPRCIGVVFRIPGSNFLIQINRYDLEND